MDFREKLIVLVKKYQLVDQKSNFLFIFYFKFTLPFIIYYYFIFNYFPYLSHKSDFFKKMQR